ncbi:MAG: TonB-dependent receptor plug domain-containing protein [Ignavibacteria bacterium]|nr:TonB-dependent receptor plug domain-containing protein [Ignavibacteria bacterium]
MATRILVLLITLSITLTVFAQKDPDSLFTKELPPIVVTDYKMVKQNNENASNNTINSELLSKIKPDKLTEALTFLPGVYSIPDGIGGQYINVRGFEQNRVNIYYNGIPLRSNTEGRLNTDAFSFTNSDISIEKGTASLLFGSNSSGNVIRIDSKQHSGKQLEAEVNTFLGENSKQYYNTFLAGKISNVLFYQSAFTYSKQLNFPLSDNFSTISAQPDKNRNNSDKESLELLANITYLFNEKHLINFTGVFNKSRFGYPPSIATPRFRRMDYWVNSLFGIHDLYIFENGLHLESNLYYTVLNDTLNEYKDKSYTTIKKISYWDDKTFGIREIASYEFLKNNSIYVSFDYKRDFHDQIWFTKATTTSNTIISAVEYNAQICPQLNLRSGVSYNFMDPTYTSKNVQITRNSLSEMNYQISASYKPFANDFSIHSGYSRNTIFPRMRDLFGDVLIGYTANPNLKSESDQNVEMGISTSLFDNMVTVEFDLYNNFVKDLITQIKDSDTTNKVINLQSANVFGGELQIKFKSSQKLSGLISYSYSSTKNTSESRLSDYIAYRPDHQLHVFVSYLPFSFIELNISSIYFSKSYYDNQSIWYSIPDYITFDLGISVSATKNLKIWEKTTNLLDKDYKISFDQPMPGREIRFGVSYSFSMDSK